MWRLPPCPPPCASANPLTRVATEKPTMREWCFIGCLLLKTGSHPAPPSNEPRPPIRRPAHIFRRGAPSPPNPLRFPQTPPENPQKTPLFRSSRLPAFLLIPP